MLALLSPIVSGAGQGAVAALVVSHDGARWLPVVIDGLRAQTRAPDRVVCVDTGSRDEGPDLLEAAFGAVRSAPAGTSYPEAVRLGLAEAGDAEWLWLLHDDSTPAPDALAQLLAAAEAHPEADLLGPKLREWPSLRRLLEVGVTISGTGRRETGLERGEYDQGQHDDVRRVLAVNSAGMLVRREVFEALGGFDDHLPVFGNDLDLGWRAAAAGHTTLVVPQAVVFHAEAAHRGVRRTPLTGKHTHFQERRAALFTLLANSPTRALPFQAVRLTLGTVLRAFGFLLVRSPGEALDELAALVSLRPRSILRARRTRQDGADVRPLLAPWWLPYRHGLDVVGGVVAAAGNQAADVAERRRIAAAERDPESFAARRPVEEDDVLEADSGWVARFLSNPVAVVLALVVLVSVVGARAAFGPVTGGALSPAPEGVGDWWRLHLESWHPLGAGTAVPAPPYLLPLALLGTLLGGSATAAVSVLLLLAVPVSLWGAWRLLRLIGRLVSPRGLPRWLLLWGAVVYALVPATSGAWGQGRLGVVAAVVVLPWLAHAAVGFADPEPDRRWRAAWRSGVLLALLVAFAPVAWLLALVLAALGVAAAARLVPDAARERSAWGPPALALGLPVVLLLPWWLPAVQHRAAEGLLLGAGRLPAPMPDGLDVLAGRLGGLGAPMWVGLLIVVLALAALWPRPTRIPVLICWLLAAVTALLTLVLSWVTLDVAGGSTPASVAVLVVVLQGALVAAVVLGALGAVELRRGASAPLPAPWRAGVVALAVVASLVPLVGLGWFAGGEHRLAAEDAAGIPAYMVQSAAQAPERGILVLTGSVRDGVDYVVRRGDGVTVGEDEVLGLSPRDTDLTALVRRAVSEPDDELATDLSERGIEYVVLPAPADGDVASVLDAAAGLVQASAEDRDTRAWRVSREPAADALDGPGSWLRPVLLLVQLAGLAVALVQCAPTRGASRTEGSRR